MASILDKYKCSPTETPEEIGQKLKEQGVEAEGNTTQTEVGEDRVNVAGGYENVGKDKPNNETLAAAQESAQEKAEEQINADPSIKDGLSEAQQEEER